ncbi:HTH_48 domain-containing protein [Trichonephila clavipes]|nr:HTH_48 domain-containing protein [Trichonephila clavipes]
MCVHHEATEYGIEDSPVCDAASKVAKAMVSELILYAAANVVALFVQTLVVMQMTPILDSGLVTWLHDPAARNMSAADIHRQITEVYGTESMSGSKFRKRVKKFGRTIVHDEERSSRPSVITDEFKQANETKICVNRRFTITTLSLEFPDVSWSVMYNIVTEDLKNCVIRW